MTNTPDGAVPAMTSDQTLTRVVELLRELETDLTELAGWALDVDQVERFYNLYEQVGMHDAARQIDAAFEDSYESVDWETERPDWEIEDLNRQRT